MQSRFPSKEAVKASINIQLVIIGPVVSVDWEHGTRMDHIASAPATHPVTQVLLLLRRNGYYHCSGP
jgi:hypothetical protein